MESTIEQNSATILPLWHCIFAVSANKDAKKGELKEENAESMEDIYKNMRSLRLANHEPENPALISFTEIAKPFNSMFSGMPKEKWIGEFCSFMREVVNMRDEFEGLKECIHSIDLSNPSTLLDDYKPKDIITLLTLWYWLAAWSSLDHTKVHCAKDEFIQAIEAQSKALGFLMVKTTPIDPIEQQELENLLSKLLQMLKLDYQLWMDSLNQFIGIWMLQLSTATEASKAADVTLSMARKPSNNKGKNRVVKGVATSVGKEAVKLIVMEMLMEGGKAVYANKEEIVDKIKSLGHDVAEFTENEVNSFVKEVAGLLDATKKGMEQLGGDIEDAVKKALNELEYFGDGVWGQIKNKANDIFKGAEGVWDDVVGGLGKFGSIFSF